MSWHGTRPFVRSGMAKASGSALACVLEAILGLPVRRALVESLMRIAVEAAAGAAGRLTEEGTLALKASSNPIATLDAVEVAIGAAGLDSRTPGSINASLKACGPGGVELAKRVTRLRKGRHAQAHPDGRLVQDVQALVGSPPSCQDGGAVGERSVPLNLSAHFGCEEGLCPLCRATHAELPRSSPTSFGGASHSEQEEEAKKAAEAAAAAKQAAEEAAAQKAAEEAAVAKKDAEVAAAKKAAVEAAEHAALARKLHSLEDDFAEAKAQLAQANCVAATKARLARDERERVNKQLLRVHGNVSQLRARVQERNDFRPYLDEFQPYLDMDRRGGGGACGVPC